MTQSSGKNVGDRGRTSTFARPLNGPRATRSTAVKHSHTPPTASRKWTTGAARRRRGPSARRLSTLLSLLLACAVCAPAARAACGSVKPPADINCFKTLSGNITLDGDGNDWAGNDFHLDGTYGTDAELRVARKPTGDNKSDLYLFFKVTGDSVASFDDRILIALNPGTAPGDSTLVELNPYGFGNPPEKQFYSLAGGAWVNPQTPGSWFSYGVSPARPANVTDPLPNNPSATWTAEVKISLDQIPTHPITGPTFRLYVELISADGTLTGNTPFIWPQPDNWAAIDPNLLCPDPTLWRKFAFGTTCFPDLTIPGAPHSCDSIYVLRNGAKSTEIVLNRSNEIHADVKNLGAGNAAGVSVFLVNLVTGMGTPGVAMNFDHNDPVVKQFFKDGFGDWMIPEKRLATGTPRPPAGFTVNAGATDTAVRFRWKPADEGISLGVPPAAFVGENRCTAAFVFFKDDPNFANNFSYCNTSIINCTPGQSCSASFSTGSISPYYNPPSGPVGGGGGGGHPELSVLPRSLNTPDPDWLERVKFTIEDAERAEGGRFVVRTAARSATQLTVTLTPPPERDTGPDNTNHATPNLAPAGSAAGPDPNARTEQDVMTLRNIMGEQLHRTYESRPVIYLRGYAPVGTVDTNTTPRRTLTLSRPIGYVAFIIDTGGGAAGPSPAPTPGRGPAGCSCGRGTASGFVFSASFVVFGLALVWRRARRRSRKRVAAAPKG